MKRIRIIGLCLVAVFAFTAFAATSAQAGQLGKCVKAAKVNHKWTGHFTDKGCSFLATVPEETEGRLNRYEWVPNAGVIPFISDIASVSTLKGAAGEIVCKHAIDAGDFIGAVNSTDTFKFFECKLQPFELECQSAGAAAGEIVTYPLKDKFIDHHEKGLSGKEPAEHEVWDEFTNEGNNAGFTGEGPWLASFECGGIPFELSGSVSGVIPDHYIENIKLKTGKPPKKGKPGKPTFTEEFTETGGEQDLKTTLANPLKGNEIETGASILEGTNEVDIDPLEKGLEIDDI